MSEAPERIWAFPKKDWFNAGASTNRITAAGAKDVEYIRKDVSDALIAAAYVDAANLHQSLWRETSAYKTDQILKRTSTDTRQALDALLKAEREKAIPVAASLAAAISLLERGGKIAAPSNKMFEQMLKDYRRSLDDFRALFKKDATDG